jgi:hypothetical protein
MSDAKPIAETTIFAIDQDSREFEIRAAVGVPFQRDSGEWACPVILEGYLGLHQDIYGGDSWQSMALAQRLVHNLLSYFVADGGKLFLEKGGEEISVAELWGGVEETPEPDGPRTEEQQAEIDKLKVEHLRLIDEAILANASTQYRKVARVVGSAMRTNDEILLNIPDIFYAERVRILVAAGKLESEGNLLYMGYSEVRIPTVDETEVLQ